MNICPEIKYKKALVITTPAAMKITVAETMTTTTMTMTKRRL
jgi:hypothetical protein